MENCWFVLKQTHFPPPSLPTSGTGTANGAICPGHIVPSLKDLDGVINRSVSGFTFTQAVPIHHTCAWDMEFSTGRTHGSGFSANADAPVAAAVGVTAKANVGVAFEKSVKNHREFERLDRYIILPNRGYVKAALEDAEVKEHVEASKRLGAWKVFLITGVMVARGSRGGVERSRGRSLEGGVAG